MRAEALGRVSGLWSGFNCFQQGLRAWKCKLDTKYPAISLVPSTGFIVLGLGIQLGSYHVGTKDLKTGDMNNEPWSDLYRGLNT